MRPAGERQPYDGTTCAASTSAVRCGCCDYAVPDGRPSTCSSTSRASSTSSKSSASSRTHADGRRRRGSAVDTASRVSPVRRVQRRRLRPAVARADDRRLRGAAQLRRTARGLTPSRGRRDPSGIDIVSAAGSVEPRRNWKLAQNGYLERRLSTARLRSAPAARLRRAARAARAIFSFLFSCSPNTEKLRVSGSGAIGSCPAVCRASRSVW